MADVRIGMSGWTFEGWKGEFYPKGLSAKKELAFASRKVNSIELNGTFYRLQTPASFKKWHDETPDDFVFAIKAPQYMTHVRRLKEIEEPLATFLASGVLCLGKKLGPILWQFPPNVVLKDDRFEKFLKLLPMDTKSAAKYSKGHSEKIKSAHTTCDVDQPLRHAFEFRHPSFANPDFLDMLRAHNVAFVFAHSGEKNIYIEDLTSDFVYARMHGQEKEYKKGYTNERLQWFADRVSLWTSGKQPKDAHTITEVTPSSIKRDAFIYFDDESKVFAPRDALKLAQLLNIKEMLNNPDKKILDEVG